MSYGMWHFKFIFFHLVQCLGELSNVVGYTSRSFLFAAEGYVIVCVLYLPVEGYLGCFQFSAIMMKAAMNVFV